jgi:hypothetical protein
MLYMLVFVFQGGLATNMLQASMECLRVLVLQNDVNRKAVQLSVVDEVISATAPDKPVELQRCVICSNARLIMINHSECSTALNTLGFVCIKREAVKKHLFDKGVRGHDHSAVQELMLVPAGCASYL